MKGIFIHKTGRYFDKIWKWRFKEDLPDFILGFYEEPYEATYMCELFSIDKYDSEAIKTFAWLKEYHPEIIKEVEEYKDGFHLTLTQPLFEELIVPEKFRGEINIKIEEDLTSE